MNEDKKHYSHSFSQSLNLGNFSSLYFQLTKLPEVTMILQTYGPHGLKTPPIMTHSINFVC